MYLVQSRKKTMQHFNLEIDAALLYEVHAGTIIVIRFYKGKFEFLVAEPQGEVGFEHRWEMYPERHRG